MVSQVQPEAVSADRRGCQSDEITAVAKLLEMLSLKGCIVTLDALHCQRDVAQQIIAGRRLRLCPQGQPGHAA
jgi:propanediol dehydratase small subunit